MSRPTLLNGFHHYAQMPFGSGVVPAGPMYRLPMRAPELAAGYHQHQHQHTQQQHTGHYLGRASNLRMSGPAYMPSDEELAQLQKLSNEYDPEPTGPLVGERESSSAITNEYANGDPVFRIKTASLPRKYAYFRKCRGDGHCGWRAIAFSYYEALIRLGDVNKFDEEEVRLKSMAPLFNGAGFSEDVVGDFADEAFDLMRQLAGCLQTMAGTANDRLLQAFNDYGTSMAIITYFKLLASAWIQSHQDDFAPFLLDYPDVKSYCRDNIEAANCEIDNVGMAALGEIIVKPAGFGLEVMYLDRSPGDEINQTYRLEPTSPEGFPLHGAPTLRLLYRPGHYDILYKAEDFPSPIQSQPPLHVALATDYDEFVPMESTMPDVMTLIPGMYPTGLGQRWPSVSYEYEASPAPQPQVTPVPSYAPAPSPVAPVASSSHEYVTPAHAGHVSVPHPPSHHSMQLEPPITLPIHPPPPPPPMTIERGPPITLERGGPFRHSVYSTVGPGIGPNIGYSSGHPHSVPFQTSIFRNSHYNTAHFRNENFQPEEWSPETEYATSNRGRHKSTSQ